MQTWNIEIEKSKLPFICAQYTETMWVAARVNTIARKKNIYSFIFIGFYCPKKRINSFINKFISKNNVLNLQRIEILVKETFFGSLRDNYSGYTYILTLKKKKEKKEGTRFLCKDDRKIHLGQFSFVSLQGNRWLTVKWCFQFSIGTITPSSMYAKSMFHFITSEQS